MYPPCDIDKARERGETCAVDPETREAIDRLGTGLDRLGTGLDRLGVDLDRLGVDLRGEIRSSAAETRAYVDERIQTSAAEIRTSAAETRAYVDERLQTSAAETRAYTDDRMHALAAENRRHFEVIAESLRSDFGAVADGMALSDERSRGRDDEQAVRSDGLEGRVLRLEVRVSTLEDDRKPRRPRPR